MRKKQASKQTVRTETERQRVKQKSTNRKKSQPRLK